jgi:flagellar FliL protein
VSQTTEQRVVANKPKIGARPTAPTAVPEQAEEGKAKKGGKKKLFIIVLVVLLAGGAAYWFLLKPAAPADGAGAVAEEPAPEPGEVLVVEPISINLADGHYLRIGIGLQLTADVAEEPDTARALDLVVALFSQRPMAEVTTAEGREALKAELLRQLEETYEGEVMDVYFTDYVTQ